MCRARLGCSPWPEPPAPSPPPLPTRAGRALPAAAGPRRRPQPGPAARAPCRCRPHTQEAPDAAPLTPPLLPPTPADVCSPDPPPEPPIAAARTSRAAGNGAPSAAARGRPRGALLGPARPAPGSLAPRGAAAAGGASKAVQYPQPGRTPRYDPCIDNKVEVYLNKPEVRAWRTRACPLAGLSGLSGWRARRLLRGERAMPETISPSNRRKALASCASFFPALPGPRRGRTQRILDYEAPTVGALASPDPTRPPPRSRQRCTPTSRASCLGPGRTAPTPLATAGTTCLAPCSLCTRSCCRTQVGTHWTSLGQKSLGPSVEQALSTLGGTCPVKQTGPGPPRGQAIFAQG
jgi:hypothetical protein